MRWWKRSAYHSSSASTPASPARASTSRIPRPDGADLGGGPDLQPRLTRARRLRHVDDIEVGVSALRMDHSPTAAPSSSLPARRDAFLSGFATAGSTPISRSPSNMEVAPVRSSSTPMLLPRPLPLPHDDDSPCRGSGRPLPSPRLLDGDCNGSNDFPGLAEAGSERASTFPRFMPQTVQKIPEHNGLRSDGTNGATFGQRKKAFKDIFKDSSAETLNFRLNIPAKSAPSSGFSSPVQSPRRLSNVDLSSTGISVQGSNVLSAQSVWSPDLLGSSPPSPENFVGGQERSPRSSPLRSPALRSRYPSAPPSPMHLNLFPENHVSRPEGSGSVSFHPLPLPPDSVSPRQANFSHHSVPKVETPSMAGQWQKRKLIGSGTYGCVYEATNRYFVIIDDLWATSVWDVLSRAFPEGRYCSRIITTTEIMEVARACCGYCPDYIFQMEFLSDDDSQKLLLQRILLGNQSPQRFDHILPHIVRKCGGLPLAIIMVASLIASQPEKLDILGFVQNTFGSNLGLRAHPTMEGFMGQLLNIIFDTLPHYLRTCLLYLSTCPEGYIFLKDDLVKQWIAEDFIRAHLGGDMEEVARSYFDELVTMGLIQVMDINYDYEPFSYSVHQMILDLITYKAIEENFVTVVDYSQTAMLLPDNVRRLSLHFGSATYATTPASTRLSQVRSLFFFGLFNCMPPFVGFKLLRVLNLHIWGDLGNTSFDLTGVCELIRLRYLQVTCNVTVKLPDQIEAMKHLETLEINSGVYAIPPGIVRLPSLLHLCLRGGPSLPIGIGCIRSLRTLTYFGLGNDSKDNLWSLGELINLRDLHFTYSALPSSKHLKRNLVALASSIGKLCNLRSVTLAPGTARMVGLFDVSSDMPSAPVFLERLELLPPICTFSSLPKWIGQLRKICIVKVAVKELLTEDIDILAGLPSLRVLSLCVQTAPEGRIVFNEGAFLVLKYFEYRCGILCLAFMEGAMPNLRRLNLAFNTHIREKYSNMLAGIEHLLNLQDITGRIGAATESDRRAAESAFKEAISKHPMYPRSSIQWEDPVEKEYHPSEKQHVRQEEGSSSVFFPEKRVRTCFFCSRRRSTKMRQRDTNTKGGADRTETKKEQQKLRTLLNYVLRKNQQQSFYSSASVENKAEDPKFIGTTSTPPNSQSTLASHQNVASEPEEQMLPDATKQEYLDSNQPNVGEQIAAETGVQSQLSPPSPRSVSSARHHKGVYDSRLNLAGQDMEMSSNIISKQDLLAKVKKNEEEIVYLRKHLVNYSVKEAQILNDKLDLERDIAHMRKEFDQQQVYFVDSTSEALSYRQKITEEQMHLRYALQAAHQGRSTFISSLLPLLSEHNLQPSVCDAQSIVSNLKVLFSHLQEKLIITAEKVKESQNQIPWRAKSSKNTSGHVQSHPPGNALVSSSQPSVDIVPQQAYFHVESPISSPVRTRHDWDFSSAEKHKVISIKEAATNTEHDNVGRTSPPSSSRMTKDVVMQGTERDGSENIEGAETQTSQKPPPGSPNLASGIEESSSSLSQASEDDPLPAIDGLRITGEAFPGRELQASGYSINGTTNCIFKWVRHLEDGSVNFIEGANQPAYLVTADDVDSLLAIEIQPFDDQKRKGEIVKFYANEQEKIPCDPEMKELIKKILSIGHVSYEVLLPVRYIDMWEPAVLSIKREGYRIKYTGHGGVIITEKFTQTTSINIPYGRPNELSIRSVDGVDYYLKPAENSPSRDTITLILKLFQIKAVQRSKRRKKSGGRRTRPPRRPLQSPRQVHMSAELRRPNADIALGS